MSSSTRLGHLVAKVLGIKLDEPALVHSQNNEQITRGESINSHITADTAYYEDRPTSYEFIKSYVPTRADVRAYGLNTFPCIKWLPHYNRIWFIGDLIAGITVGAVVVPQGMAYAKLADLPVQYGLYTSFFGVLIYWIWATSKDITIGPVAVLSTLTGSIIIEVTGANPALSAQSVAATLAILAGSFVFILGILRLGFIIEFIPAIAIAAFMTGSAINIAAGQVPTMMGITGFSTRDSTYLVIIHTLQHLGRSDLNAAMGLTALFLLYTIRFTCNRLSKRFPSRQRAFFFLNTLRTVFVILLYTFVSWLVNRHRRTKPKFAILGTVPRGFQAMGVPKITHSTVTAVATHLPATIIVMLIEHIAISKSFGRVNNYVIDPSQELIALGMTNIFGPFFGAYPATGSFSRTAIKAKAGVRTPIAGVITAVVVLLAIYALTAVFFYIPSASLSAVIIHAVGDLITSPNVVYGFWRINPLEMLIFFVGVIVTIFSTIENGIYCTIGLSGGILLYRIARAHGDFLGKVRVQTLDTNEPRNLFLPIDHRDRTNPDLPVDQPAPGVFIFRFTESFLYPNANYYTDRLVAHIFANTKRTDPNSYPRLGDRPWNDPAPRNYDAAAVAADPSPNLRAVILDCTSITNVDVTSVQTLVDVRKQLERYAAPDRVEFRFATLRSAWARRALSSVGFGYVGADARPVFSIAEIPHNSSTPTNDDKSAPTGHDADLEAHNARLRSVPVTGLNYTAIHADLDEALTAVYNSFGIRDGPSPTFNSNSGKDTSYAAPPVSQSGLKES